jgi:hypothetical protein
MAAEPKPNAAQLASEDQINHVSAYITSPQPLEDRTPSPTPKGSEPTASDARLSERTP